MKPAFRVVTIVVGALFICVGVVWILQGTNILTRSVMSGHSQWMVIGIIVAILGLGLVVRGSLPRRGKKVLT